MHEAAPHILVDLNGLYSRGARPLILAGRPGGGMPGPDSHRSPPSSESKCISRIEGGGAGSLGAKSYGRYVHPSILLEKDTNAWSYPRPLGVCA